MKDKIRIFLKNVFEYCIMIENLPIFILSFLNEYNVDLEIMIEEIDNSLGRSPVILFYLNRMTVIKCDYIEKYFDYKITYMNMIFLGHKDNVTFLTFIA